jgi:hypothetical protein
MLVWATCHQPDFCLIMRVDAYTIGCLYSSSFPPELSLLASVRTVYQVFHHKPMLGMAFITASIFRFFWQPHCAAASVLPNSETWVLCGDQSSGPGASSGKFMHIGEHT